MAMVAFFQASSSFRQEKWGELVVFGLVWSIATIYGLLVIIGANVPKPAMFIVEFFESISEKAGSR